MGNFITTQIIKLLDIQIFYFINKAFHNVALDLLMAFLTELGSARFACGIGLICLFFRKKEIKLLGVFLLAAAYVNIIVGGFLKELFMIPRPYKALEGVSHFISVGDYSFPSGHSSMAFLTAAILTLEFKQIKQKIFLYLLALTVGLSRIYLGVHYPSDILAGAILGLAIAYVFLSLYRRSLS